MAGGVNCVTAGSGMVDEDFIGHAEDIRDRGFAVAKRAATVEPQPGA
jgi:hypothetical protein